MSISACVTCAGEVNEAQGRRGWARGANGERGQGEGMGAASPFALFHLGPKPLQVGFEGFPELIPCPVSLL